MLSVVTVKHSNIHKTLYTYIIEKLSEQQISNIFETIFFHTNSVDTLVFHGSFETDNEADICFKMVQLNNAKEYTKYLIETSIPNPISDECRYVLTYISSHITPSPGFYRISLNDYIILKHNFSDCFRFPTINEISTIFSLENRLASQSKDFVSTIESTDDVIVVNEKLFEIVMNLLSTSRFMKDITDPLLGILIKSSSKFIKESNDSTRKM